MSGGETFHRELIKGRKPRAAPAFRAAVEGAE